MEINTQKKTLFDFLQDLKNMKVVVLKNESAYTFLTYIQDFEYIQVKLAFKDGNTIFTKI